VGTQLRENLEEALGGVYALEHEIEGAGMSRVFVAQDIALGRRIVVKLLPPEMAGAIRSERFRREIQLAASLVHPHIIPLLSAGETLGLPYYTMPFVEGESLRARLTREWRLPIDEAVRIASEVAGALDYAHRSGVVHRDMKPANILTHEGHALVTDFGIARALRAAAIGSELTSVGIAIGTPAYMSPEQTYGDPRLDGRSDIYSLGCVLFEMLSGSPPFTGLDAQSILMRHSVDPIPSVRAGRPEIPIAIERALNKALAKSPDGRFTSAAEFAAALEDHSKVSTPSGAEPSTAHRSQAIQDGAQRRFIAVLPFDNMSADPENEYFSDGITEDIIAQLSKIRGLRVMSRTSVMRYKRHPQSVRKIGQELGVSHLLEGSVRRAGKKVRIVAQLIDVSSDEHLWAETWDRDITDIFAIQTEVAEHIAGILHAQLSPTDRSRLAKKPTSDMEAYNLYLLGRHHYNKVTPSDFAKAMDYFRRAIERDPEFAQASASLAEAKLYLGMGYWGVRPHDTHPEAFELATKVTALDPLSAEAHASLGLYHEWYRYDWDKGGANLQKATELNPSSPMIRLYYAMHLCAVGRFDEAMVHRDLACQLDPSAMAVRGNASWVLYLARRMDQAVADGRSLREIDPSSAYGAFSHGLICAQSGDAEEAVAAFRDGVRLAEGVSLYLVMLAYGLAVAGEHTEARTILADLEERSKTEFVWPMGLAFAYAHLGDENTALDLLERAYDERVGYMLMIGRDAALDVLRPLPRFQSLLRKIGPPEAIGKL
jgi:eukaryotic-like serine/threonine-protein kinase